jgi:hypothetical protein
MELIQPSSTAKNDSVMARVIDATSDGECVPTGASRFITDAAVFTDVLTEDPDGGTDEFSPPFASLCKSDDVIDGGGSELEEMFLAARSRRLWLEFSGSFTRYIDPSL